MGVSSGLYMYDVVVTRSRSLSHLLMSSCWFFFLFFRFCAVRYKAGHLVSFWAHVDLPHRIVSYRIQRFCPSSGRSRNTNWPNAIL